MNLTNSISRFRVIFESRENYRLLDEKHNICPATISGNARNAEFFPTVGDWVTGSFQPGGWVLIAEIEPRYSELIRSSGAQQRPQILAANVNTLFIVTSANQDFNLNRLERYVGMAIAGNVQPVILINKIELAAKPQDYIEQAATRFANVDVHGVSAAQQWNLEVFELYQKSEATLAFAGSSGVGKSSLTNALLGKNLVDTSEIRERDGRGRHTTTHRELHVIPGGCYVIDTPGLRSLSLSGDSDLNPVFGDIQNLERQCRFSDCQHQTEPGCAVLGALDSGELDEQRWKNYGKMQRELAFESRKQSKALQSETKKQWAKRSQQVRQSINKKRI